MTTSVNLGELLEDAGLEEPEPFAPLEIDEAREEAIALIEAGFAVVPAWGVAEPGVCACRKPACAAKHTVKPGWGTSDRSFMDVEHAAGWWSPRVQSKRWAVDNIAVVCYGSGVVVADVDDRARFETWVSRSGAVPDTLQSTTGRGKHYYFRPSDEIVSALPKARSKLGLNSGEWRWKAIVIAPPSVHLGTGARYRWVGNGLSGPIADLPPWMHTHAFIEASPAGTASAADDAFIQQAARGYLGPAQCQRLAQRALLDTVRDIARAAPGTRRTILNAASFSVGKWGCAAGWTSQDWLAAKGALISAAAECGLPELEATHTTEAALNDGAATFRKMYRT